MNICNVEVWLRRPSRNCPQFLLTKRTCKNVMVEPRVGDFPFQAKANQERPSQNGQLEFSKDSRLSKVSTRSRNRQITGLQNVVLKSFQIKFCQRHFSKVNTAIKTNVHRSKTRYISIWSILVATKSGTKGAMLTKLFERQFAPPIAIRHTPTPSSWSESSFPTSLTRRTVHSKCRRGVASFRRRVRRLLRGPRLRRSDRG